LLAAFFSISVDQGRSQMMHSVTKFLLFAVVAEAKWAVRHHDALIGHKGHIPNPFIKGHVQDNFVIKPFGSSHDSLTGQTSSIPGLFVKGNLRDNFVVKNPERHHDALTGHTSTIPGLHVKGHVADLPPTFENYYSPKSMGADIAMPPMSEEFTFCKVSGDQCSQYTLNKWMRLGTTLSGFKEGTCWEHGYTANEGSKEISIPFIGQTNVRFFKESKKEIKRMPMEAFAQSSPDGISVLAVALISLVGVSGAFFAILHVRRGTFTAGKEVLLTTSNV
jgi:hypothetical protein